MAQNSGNEIIQSTENLFKNLPPLPPSARETLVTITPWLALIFGVLGVLASLAGLGLVGIFSPVLLLGGGVGSATGSLISAILALASSALLLASYPGVKARKMSGWRLLFWSEAVSVLSSVLSFALGGILFALIGFYILFQIKSYYK